MILLSRFSAVFALLLLAAGGCGPTKYEADRAAGLGEAEAAVLTVEPSVRLASLDGEPVGELPVVGVRNLHRDRGTHRRVVRLAPGRHEVVAGVGPMFSTTLGRRSGLGAGAGAAAGMGMGGGTHLSVGFGSGGGGQSSATFRYPGSEVDERAESELEPGRRYTLGHVPDADPDGPGWRLRVAPADAPAGTLNVARPLDRRDSPHAGEPFRRYFDPE